MGIPSAEIKKLRIAELFNSLESDVSQLLAMKIKIRCFISARKFLLHSTKVFAAANYSLYASTSG